MTPWARQRLGELFSGLVLADRPGGASLRAECTVLASLDGDCVLNQRKGKLIPSYDLQLRVHWTGEQDGQALAGTLELLLADENADDDQHEIAIRTPGESPLEVSARRAIVRAAHDGVARAVAMWVKEMAAGAPLDKKKGASHAEANGPAEVPAAAPATARSAGATSSPAPSPATAAPSTNSPAVAVRTGGRIVLEERFTCRAADVFEALTDPRRIMGFTQSPAEGVPIVGGMMRMFAGAVEAEYLSLTPPSLIEQRWRRSEWPEGCWSHVRIEVEERERGQVRLRLTQEGIPETDKFGNADVVSNLERGWRERIFGMIRKVFGFGHNMFE